MASYNRHIFSQRRGVVALGQLLVSNKRAVGQVTTPGPVLARRVVAPSSALIDDFVRFSGGNPAAYRGVVPAPLFCQWSLPLMLEVASTLPYPPTKVINAGCELRVSDVLPRGTPLEATAQVVEIDENERRAKLTIRVGTRAVGGSELIVADLRVLIPLQRASGGGPKREKPRVPSKAREIERARLSSSAGADFAKLTGDFNPIHWLRPYARAVGFRGVILHGFGVFARAHEALARGLLSGDVQRIRSLSADFTRPLVLPLDVGVYVDGHDQVLVGDAPGGAAYMVGKYTLGPKP